MIIAQAVAVIGFLLSVADFHHPGKGFTGLIVFGSRYADRALPQIRETPHVIVENSDGYDGQAYAQVAMDPLLRDPALMEALDSFSYRARRILMPAVAHIVGLGRPAWVLQAYALLNPVCWLVLAVLLFRWFRPGEFQGSVRWFGILFSTGMLFSFRNALPDGPALLLLVLSLALCESGRSKSATGTLALAALTRETSILAAMMIPSGGDFRNRRWLRVFLTGLGVVLPLIIWMLYVNSRAGSTGGPEMAGVANFALPFSGWLGSWRETFQWDDWTSRIWYNRVATLVGITVQAAFFLFRWRWSERRWRLGFLYALLGLVLGSAVWAGYPIASARVLLPLTLAFNLAVPHTWRWFPVLLLGNVSIIAAPTTLDAPAIDRFQYVSGPAEWRQTAGESHWEIEFSPNWYQLEKSGKKQWRWSPGNASIVIRNQSNRVYEADLRLVLRSRESRSLTIRIDGSESWSGVLTKADTSIGVFARFPPGDTLLEFESQTPPRKASPQDQRVILFRLNKLEIHLTRETATKG